MFPCRVLKMCQKGFSLVELLVVVAIIGVLAGVGVVGYQQYTESTKMRVFIQNVTTVTRAVDFEHTVVSNGLISAIKEVDKDGNMIDEDGNTTTDTGAQRVISNSSSCENFVFSIKEHFKDFKNPWKPEKNMITIDTQAQNFHKQGMLQLVCFRASNFLTGWNCTVPDSMFHLIAFYHDGVVKPSRTDTNGIRAGNAVRNSDGVKVSDWFNRGFVPDVSLRAAANLPWMTASAGEALCGSDGWTISAITVDADADY